MPPQLSSSSFNPPDSQVTPLLTTPPKSRINLPIISTQNPNRIMVLAKKKLIPILVLVLTIFSVLRLLKLTITTSPHSFLQTRCSSLSPACSHITITPNNHLVTSNISGSGSGSGSGSTTLTKKEFEFLYKIVSIRAPCNLLIFGIPIQYLVNLTSMNTKGLTVFLDDNPENIRAIQGKYNNTRAYMVKYKAKAKDGYKLLKHARENPGCFLDSRVEEATRCKLAMKDLPKEVNELNWDVVVIDGPSGDGPEALGRMASIYTASVIARRGNASDVVVHDVDRTIEKWFSLEFLCMNNLVSSKGKFWNFRIGKESKSNSFCAL